MENNTEKIPTETCVVCGEDTGVSINTHIDMRKTYIEGAGQLCAKCFVSLYKQVHGKNDND